MGVRAARPARGRDAPTTSSARPTAGRRSRCRAAGRCRASTARSTRTCRCRSPARRRAVPDDNPTGVYRRTVTVPARRGAASASCCTSAAPESVLYVHVDGVPRRHGQGLAPAARVRPHRRRRARADRSSSRSRSCGGRTRPTSRIRTTGTTPGLHRSVFLYATPPVHIADVHATADYDPDTGDGPARASRSRSTPPAHAPRGWTARVDVAGRAADADGAASSTRPTGSSTSCASRAGARPCRADGPGRRAVDRGDAEPPRPDRHARSTPTASRSTRCRSRVGFRRVEVRGPELLVNGRPVLDQGRQPPRPRSAPRQGRDPRVDRGRRGADEAAQHQRDPHVALPERRVPLRRVRPARHVRGRRGQHRDARLPAQPHQGSDVDAGDARAHHAHGAARQEPPVDHHVVARQRERRVARRTSPRPRGCARGTRPGPCTTRAASAKT